MKTLIFFITVLAAYTAKAQTNSILRGNQLYKAGQFEQAEIQYRKALESDPTNTSALHNLSNALHRQGKFEEAIRVTNSLVKSAKDSSTKSTAYYNQGVSYTKQYNLEASIDSYKKALIQNPNDQQARENLEKALLQLKKQQQQQQQKKKQSSDMSQKEADQKLKQLQQREKELQQKINRKSQGGGQAQDW
jgi:Ca-activated chloride channel homolog